MLRSRRAVVLCLAMIGLSLAGPRAVAAAPVPVTVLCPAGASIASPGSYRVTSAVLDCNAPTMITISASNVNLDLGGAVLDGDDINCLNGILVTGPQTKIKIKNGTVRDCRTGIDISSATKSKISGIVVRSTGVLAPPSGEAVVLGSSNTFTGNTVAENVRYGVNAGGSNVITKNSFVGNSQWALVAGGLNKIVKNAFNNNEVDAMFVTGSKNLFSGNNAHGNGGDGICTFGDFNLVTKNYLTGNGEAGIEMHGHSNKVVANIARANKTGGILVDDANSVTSNDVSGNEATGIAVDAADDVISDTKIASNKSNGNLGDGITLVDPVDGPPSTVVVRGNTTNGNTEQGIDTAAGAAPNGAGTNHASGNIVSPQCDAALC